MALKPIPVIQPGFKFGNDYNIVIFVLTIISLIIMVALFLPLGAPTLELLHTYDDVICSIFLFDFFLTLWASPKKADYFFKERGWLDLLGSIPSLGLAPRYVGLLRLARLSRVVRLARRMNGRDLLREINQNRSRYTAVITVLLTFVVLGAASVLELQFESQSPQAKITTGAESLWYSVVTITTVGYGDYYPVTTGGRITAVVLMVAGLGLIGVLASLMASLLIGSPSGAEDNRAEGTLAPATASTVEEELAAIKAELAALRQLMEKMEKMAKESPN